jgi:hypothetical protein
VGCLRATSSLGHELPRKQFVDLTDDDDPDELPFAVEVELERACLAFDVDDVDRRAFSAGEEDVQGGAVRS